VEQVPDLIEEDIGPELELAENVVGSVLACLARVGVDVNHVSHVQGVHIHLDWQRAVVVTR
jgi:hypothetical protein